MASPGDPHSSPGSYNNMRSETRPHRYVCRGYHILGQKKRRPCSSSEAFRGIFQKQILETSQLGAVELSGSRPDTRVGNDRQTAQNSNLISKGFCAVSIPRSRFTLAAYSISENSTIISWPSRSSCTVSSSSMIWRPLGFTRMVRVI